MDLSLGMIAAWIVLGAIAVILGVVGLIKAFYVKVDQGTALIINDLSSTPKVKFIGGIGFPVV